MKKFNTSTTKSNVEVPNAINEFCNNDAEFSESDRAPNDHDNNDCAVETDTAPRSLRPRENIKMPKRFEDVP